MSLRRLVALAGLVGLAGVAGLVLSGCGLSAPSAPTTTVRVLVVHPPTVSMALRLPGGHRTTARSLRLVTHNPAPVIRGAVSPAGATLYVRSPDGAVTTVPPRPDGRFAVRTDLAPGRNAFEFIAYRLGSTSRTARVALVRRGSAPTPRAVATAPTAPAAPTVRTDIVTVAAAAPPVALDPIRAPAPPANGGGGRWLNGFELTEYYPALEAWSTGRAVSAPGLAGRHRIDWLYSAHGLSMEGEGIGLDGRWYHIAGLGTGGWVTEAGTAAAFGDPATAPFWRSGGFWRTAHGAVTFPLSAGGWFNGPGVRYVAPPAGISFAPGQAKPLTYLRSIAVDPRVIPLGSYVYIPAYAPVNGGWFEAQDTGGAIIGRHIDVFRPPPSSPNDPGTFATGQQVYVVPPGRSLP